jgi:hypothetical protein
MSVPTSSDEKESMKISKKTHFIFLFCTQLITLSLIGSIFFDDFARVLIPPSRDPQGGMIGVGGLAYVTLPFILIVILSSFALASLVNSVFKNELKTLVTTGLISTLVTLSLLFVTLNPTKGAKGS